MKPPDPVPIAARAVTLVARSSPVPPTLKARVALSDTANVAAVHCEGSPPLSPTRLVN